MLKYEADFLAWPQLYLGTQKPFVTSAAARESPSSSNHGKHLETFPHSRSLLHTFDDAWMISRFVLGGVGK